MARGWNREGTFYIETCYTCQVEFGLPASVHNVLRQMADKATFYCPYGHAQSYVKGQSQEDKLRQERDRLAQRLAERDDTIRELHSDRLAALKRVAVEKGKVTRLKNRTAAGVCPCCNRHFTALERHMHTKHPEFKKEDA